MVITPGTALPLTVVFGLSSAYHLLRSILASGWRNRLGYLIALVMGVAMIAMLWGVAGPALSWAQIVFFGLAFLWYGRCWLVGRAAKPDDHEAHGQVLSAHHSAMVLAMVWMAGSVQSAGGHGSHDSPAAATSVALGALVFVVILLALIALLAVRCAAEIWARRPAAAGAWSGTADTICHVAMSVAMLGVIVPMVQ